MSVGILRILQGAVSPEALTYRFQRGTSEQDLTTYTVARFDVHFPDGTTAAWSVLVVSVAPEELKLVHPLQLADTAQLGAHRFLPVVGIDGGELSIEEAVEFVVEPRWPV